MWLILLLPFAAIAQSYTLTDNDVEVVDGYIESCSYDFSNKDIIIPDVLDGQTVIGIGEKAFISKGIETVVLPNTLEHIGKEAFRGWQLNELKLPANLKTIGRDAFFLNNYTSVVLPNGITHIGDRAFGGTDISSVTIPSSIVELGSRVFDTDFLTNILFEANSQIEEISDMAYLAEGEIDNRRYTLPSNSNPNFKYYLDSENTKYYPGDEVDFQTYIYAYSPYTLSDEDVEVVDGVITSCSYSFDVVNIIIPEILDGQTVIGIADGDSWNTGVFYSKGIRNVEFPESLEYIGEYTFRSNSIYSVNLPLSLTKIGSGAFDSNWILDVALPESIKEIGGSAFAYNRISKISMPAGIEMIGDYAFENNKLTSVVFAGNCSLLKIEEGCFTDNSELTSFLLPTNDTNGFSHYYDNKGNSYNEGETITDLSLEISAYVNYILTDADVEVVDGVITSCSYDFKFKNLIIPSELDGQTVTGIASSSDGEGVFYSKQIRNLTLPNTLETLGDYSFSNNWMRNITIPKSVKTIGIRSFCRNDNINVTFEPLSNIIKIGDDAFNCFSNYYNSTITFPTNAHSDFQGYILTDGTIYQPGDVVENLDKKVRSLIPYTLTDDDVVMLDGYIQSCSYNFELTDIVIPETLDGQTVIGITDGDSWNTGVFYYKGITSLELPNTLEYVGEYAFYEFNDNGITSLTIPSAVKTIKQYAFGIYFLKDVVFAENSNIEVIEAYAFDHQQDELKITLASHANPSFISYLTIDGTTYDVGDVITNITRSYFTNAPYTLNDEDVEIENGYIKNCTIPDGKKFITIPSSLNGQTVIGLADRDYSDVNSLSFKGLIGINLPASLEYIGSGALYSNSIISLTIPKSVKSIKEAAFKFNRLNSVFFEENSQIEIIQEDAFESNSNLAEITFPTHSNAKFKKYYDISNVGYEAGDKITDFTKSYYADIPYTLNDNDVEVEDGVIIKCSYSFEYKDIIIPSYLDGQEVIAIAGNDFKYKGIRTLSLPEGLSEIKEQVFYSNDIIAIDLPSTITQIGHRCFYGNNISALNIPSSAEIIEEEAFYGNPLTSVEFAASSNIQHIGLSAFNASTILLTSIAMPSHQQPDFVNYYDTEGNIFAPADEIIDFTNEYFARVTYQLTDDDVEVVDGVITSCTYNSYFKDIIIPTQLDGQIVTGIGTSVFSGKGLRSVQLPPSIKRIENSAFSSNHLTRVDLPEGIEYIGRHSFEKNQLQELELPNSISVVESYAFYSNKLKSVVFLENSFLSYIGSWAFNYNNELTDIILPANALPSFKYYLDTSDMEYEAGDKIKDFTLSYRSRFPYTLTDEDVVVEEGKLKSCSYDFSNKDIVIPDVLDGQTVIAIDGEVFYDKGLEFLQLPTLLELIGEKAFENNELEEIILPATIKNIEGYAFRSNNLKGELFVPQSIETIGYSAFSINKLSTVVFEDNTNLRYVEPFAFEYNAEELTGFNLPTHSNSKLINYLNGSGVFAVGDMTSCADCLVVANIPYTLTDDDVKMVDGYIDTCFVNDKYMSIIIPETLAGEMVVGISDKDYNQGAFKDKQIVSLQLPNTIKYIGAYAFDNTSLYNLNIPASVEVINTCAFSSSRLQNVKFETNSNLYVIRKNAFASNYNLEQIQLPTHASSSFINYKSSEGDVYLEGASISHFHITYQANLSYTLTSEDVVVEDGVIVSCSYDFKAKSITIPETLDDQTVIGIKGTGFTSEAIFSNKGIVKVVFPSALEHIGSYSFFANRLSEVELKDGLKEIGMGAFESNKITKVNIPNSVEYIRKSAFNNNHIAEVTFEENSNILTIEQYAWSNNSDLEHVVLPTHANDGFTDYFDDMANSYQPDYRMSDFSRVYYSRIPYTLNDDDVEVENGRIVSCSYDFANKDIVIPEQLDGEYIQGIADKPGETGVFEGNAIRSVRFPVVLTHIGENAFKFNEIIDITISNALWRVGERAFYDNDIKTITIPNSILSIGDYAFYGNQFNEINLADNSDILYIGYSAFKGSENTVESFKLPTNKTYNFNLYKDEDRNEYEEGKEVTDFYHCYYVDIPYTLTYADVTIVDGYIDSCLYNFDHKVIEIPERMFVMEMVDIIGISDKETGVFENKGIQELKLPEGLEYIGDNTFESNKLDAVILPSTLKHIGRESFSYNRLKEINIPSNVQRVDDMAFYANQLFQDDNETSSCITFEANSDILYIGKNAFNRYYEGVEPYVLPIHANSTFEHYFDNEGNVYNAGEEITNGRVAYYTKIAPVTITFDGNGNEVGEVPGDITLDISEEFTLPGKGYLHKPEFRFVCWNTKPDGTGVDYNVGDKVDAPLESITLYVKWEEYVGINNKYADAILIYPNPVMNNLCLKVENILIGKTVEITSISGKRMITKLLKNLDGFVNVSELPRGIYIISIDGLPVSKIIKQ